MTLSESFVCALVLLTIGVECGGCTVRVPISHDLQHEASVDLMQQLSSFDEPSQVLLDKREVNGTPYAHCNTSGSIESEPSHRLSIDGDAMECIFVRSDDGVYRFWADSSTSNTLDEVCGLYVIARPDQLVRFDFEQLNVSCDASSALAVVDGWELNGQLFPGSVDHSLDRPQRFRSICGDQVTPEVRTFHFSQNVALLQFRIRNRGEGFRVRVRFVHNPSRECHSPSSTCFASLSSKLFH
jgi:hypothetical protein